MDAIPVQIRLPLDVLAVEFLPPLVTAIDTITIERWRRPMQARSLTQSLPHAATPSPRVLPVVVLGEIVIVPVQFPDPLMLQVQDGKSYQAMVAAMRHDHEVVLVFVAEGAIAGFRSSVAQALPTVGVIARIQENGDAPGGWHRIQVEAVSRAEIVARTAHLPFYQAHCIPRAEAAPDSATAARMVRQVKGQVRAFILQTSSTDATRTLAFVNSIQDPGTLADVCSCGPMFSFGERVTLLQTLDPMERLRLVQQKLGREHDAAGDSTRTSD